MPYPQNRQRKGEEKSKNWLKNKQKIDKLQAKIARQKKNFLNNESRKIAENYDIAIVEDINLQNMANHKRHGGKSISRINFGMFRTMLKYKLEEKNKLLLVADKFFPSSQLCSVCGFQNHELKNLKIRNWTCPECKTEHNRDINSAINCRNYMNRGYTGDCLWRNVQPQRKRWTVPVKQEKLEFQKLQALIYKPIVLLCKNGRN